MLHNCISYNFIFCESWKIKLGHKKMSEPNPVGVGRPALPKKEKRGKFISTRVSPPEYAEIHAAIKSSGIAKTEWVRTKLIAAARRA
jgi:hypothetical protein